jgi:hypothetical protein
MGTFDSAVVFDDRHSNSAMRNSSSILIAFAIGYFGYGNVLLNENASISSTASILLSSSVGAAIPKNLARLQGVVLGTVVGKLVWALLGWCTWWGYISLCIAIFCWNFLCLYVYYDSPTYGGIACLLSAFGSSQFLVGCTDPLTATFDPAGPFYEIINVVCSIGIMIFVDMLLAPGRASEMACQSFKAAVKNLRKTLDELIDPKLENVRIHSGALKSLIASAKSLGAESWEEPRYWRTGWKMALWNQSCQCLADLRVTITAMEYSVTQDGVPGGPKTQIYMMLLKKPQFKKIQDALYAQFDAVETLWGIFEHETSEPLTAETHEGRVYAVLEDPRMKRHFKEEMEETINELMEDINAALAKSTMTPKAEANLENDQAAQVSFCLSAFLMMMDQLHDMQQLLLKE